MQEKSSIISSLLDILQSKIDKEGYLEVIGEGAVLQTLQCSFNSPASLNDLVFVNRRGLLPHSYQEFLLSHNGAKLYKDAVYGQWGFHLYGIEELLAKQEQWARIYAPWPSSYVVFGECLGDADLLLGNRV